MIRSYIKFLLRSGNEHSIHSPFLFDLYTTVISQKRGSKPGYSEIKKLREDMLSSRESIEVLDLGAGSRVSKSNLRTISSIAKNAEKPAKFGKLFFRMIERFQPETILELGTSLGITTLYLSKARPEAEVITFEGCPETAKVAEHNFAKAGAKNIRTVVGNIDQTLPEVVKTLKKPIDFAYFDANHRYEPTVRYFNDCLPYINNESVFIFDDIYWSEGMTKAWEEIKQHPQVTLAVDLFWIGLVFFRTEQAKEDFTLRF